ncbi:hypothetical protein EDI_083090 [Entamoeba dispar SAW760]|uniref:Uncharacterized protein n=1 Tax=Entamoeba dispar (strain ATCC PRA-260 / SAW760) TaxID=370354 RepID=B0EKJ1_ENTDS|nr:uncharacterized protein EDI_083090 [Entamoeba dispar SAW760]EDR24956.1 hypothetical protein EDI_083090 [Entamoeba dispar SAW760]|eukprot:EDR24956.1 hypothetical protein EDI_083090 [Entamoeba dispar SAW760]
MFIALLALATFAAAENIYLCKYSDGKLSSVQVYENRKCFYADGDSEKYEYVPATADKEAYLKYYKYDNNIECSAEGVQPKDIIITKKSELTVDEETTKVYYLYNEEPNKMNEECKLVDVLSYSDNKCTKKITNEVMYSCDDEARNDCHSSGLFYLKPQYKVGYYAGLYYLDDKCTKETGLGAGMFKCGMCVPVVEGQETIYAKYECEDECEKKPNDDGSIATIVAFIAIALFLVF